MQEAAKIAAQWWADQLRRPPKMDNGDPRTVLFAHLMQAEISTIIPGEKIQVFQEALERLIIEKWNRSQSDVLVDVDYDPNDILMAAAKEADISLSSGTLPIKTVMWVKAHEVKLRHGYGAKAQLIFEGSSHE